MLALIMGVGGILVLPNSADARQVNFVVGCSGSVYQPPKIALTCADGKSSLTRIRAGGMGLQVSLYQWDPDLSRLSG